MLVSSDLFTRDLVTSLTERPVRDIVAWDKVDVWWSDTSWAHPSHDDQLIEQFQALKVRDEALHPMKSRRPTGRALDAVAAYAAQLGEALKPGDQGPIPTFDVALLPIGINGSVAGLHPQRPTLHDTSPITVDPHSRQITLTLPALNSVREVWLVASGQEVSPAVASAVEGSWPDSGTGGSGLGG